MLLDGPQLKSYHSSHTSHTSARVPPLLQVYSFGMILWELYMGKRPFGGMTPSQVGGG